MRHFTQMNIPLSLGGGAWCSSFTVPDISDEKRARLHVFAEAIAQYLDNNRSKLLIDATASLQGVTS